MWRFGERYADKLWPLLGKIVETEENPVVLQGATRALWKLRQRTEYPLDDVRRERFFYASLPVLDKVISFGTKKDTGTMLAPTAHYFMQLLNGVLRYNPGLVLAMATDVVTSSKRFNFTLDPMALREAVELVESLLADHRAKIQEDASIKNLVALLDSFVEVGWPEALQLVWRLDEIYR